MVQRNGDRLGREAKEAERQRNENSLGFGNEIGGKQMAALEFSNSTIGAGLLRAWPSDDRNDSRLPIEIIEFRGK